MRKLSHSLGLALTLTVFGAMAVEPASAPRPDHRPAPADAGLQVRESASEAELGVPVYPGSQVQRDDADDKAAVSLGLWGGRFGLRIAVRKMRSNDPLPAVAAFYRQRLAAHGPVLECLPGAKPPVRPAAQRDDRLNCDDAPPKPGGLVLKVGTPRNQRVVALQPQGREVHYQIVRVELQGD